MAEMNTLLTRLNIEGETKLALRFPKAAIRAAGPALSAALGRTAFSSRARR